MTASAQTIDDVMASYETHSVPTARKLVLKRIRKGAYESYGYLVQYVSWTNERWDGPHEEYRGWRVYRAGSFIEKRVLLDAFSSRRQAYEYVQVQLAEPPAAEPTEL